MEIEEMQELLDVDPPESLWSKIEAGIAKLHDEMKRCPVCEAKKPLVEFYKNQSWCIACYKDYREKNKAKRRITYHKYYLENAERLKEKQRTYGQDHKETVKERKLQERICNPAKYMLRTKRNECKKFGVEFTLEMSDLLPLPEICPVLGIKLNYVVLSGRPENNSPSIDRLNNAIGYLHGNVRVISNRANRLKSDGTAEEHQKIVDYMKGENVRISEAVETFDTVGTAATTQRHAH